MDAERLQDLRRMVDINKAMAETLMEAYWLSVINDLLDEVERLGQELALTHALIGDTERITFTPLDAETPTE